MSPPSFFTFCPPLNLTAAPVLGLLCAGVLNHPIRFFPTCFFRRKNLGALVSRGGRLLDKLSLRMQAYGPKPTSLHRGFLRFLHVILPSLGCTYVPRYLCLCACTCPALCGGIRPSYAVVTVLLCTVITTFPIGSRLTDQPRGLPQFLDGILVGVRVRSPPTVGTVLSCTVLPAFSIGVKLSVFLRKPT